MSLPQKKQQKYAIRFGLGAIKAVGFNAMEEAVSERKKNGKFEDVFDFAKRLDPKLINKKSIEALAKSGGFDSISNNRCQVAESFDVLSTYAVQQKEAATTNQMSLFGGIAELNKKPELKKISNWNKQARLQKEFEAFGFFLNEHPIDDYLQDLRRRGAIFSEKIERDELEDGSLVKMGGVVAASKHRSSARGRFAYLTISDPFGIFEAMVFDEALITAARDIITDGSSVVLECLIRKDEGGTRILVRDVKKLEDFIKSTKPAEKDFEDIRKQTSRRNNSSGQYGGGSKQFSKNQNQQNSNKTAQEIFQKKEQPERKIFSQVEVKINGRDAIFSLKAFLSQCMALEDSKQFSRVVLSLLEDQKISKIQLAQKYLIGEMETEKLKRIAGVAGVDAAD